MTKEELKKEVEEWVEKEYDVLKYEKCERKDFIFTYYELKEMGKQAFLAGAEPREKRIVELESKIKQQEQQLIKSKELIKNIIRVTWSEGWSYSLDVKVKAEQFLKKE